MQQDDDLRITMRITVEQGFELLSRLATDDEFRRDVEKDPGEVLAGYGIEIEPSSGIPHRAELPPPEEIQALLESLGDDDDPFGRYPEGTWRYKLLGVVAAFPALPLVQRRDAKR